MTYRSRDATCGRRISLATVIAALGFACLCPTAVAWSQQELPEALGRLFQAGVTAEKAGRLDEAEQAFLDVLRQGGNVAFVHHNLGTVYQQRGEQARAIVEFREAIRLQPRFAPAHILLGASLLAVHKFPEGVRELQQAVELAPLEPAAHVELAKAYQLTGNPVGVVNEFQVLCKLAPGEPEYTYQLGQAHLKLSEWCLGEIRRLGPHSARMYQSTAEALVGLGQAARAIHYFQLTAQADPKLPGIHLALAQIYLNQNHLDEAQREIGLELDLVPGSVAALRLQERIASRRGQDTAR
jgi:tetratricopeptide (TPR) repeat protein